MKSTRVQPFRPLGLRVKSKKVKPNKKQVIDRILAQTIKPIKPND